jgi:hypothetical protein
MAQAELPSTWSKVGQDLHANSLWILPLGALERGLDGHPYQSAAAGVLWFISAYAAVKLNVLQRLLSDGERRQRLLTWALIIAGAMLLAAGIYRLAQLGPSNDRAHFTQQEVDEKVEAALKTERVKQHAPTIIHDQPTQEQIQQAVKPLLADLTRQRDTLEVKLTDALNARKQPQGFQPFESGPILTRRLLRSEAGELLELLVQITDIIRSVKQLPSIDDLLITPGSRPRMSRPFYTVLQRDGIPAALDRLQGYQRALSELMKTLDARVQDKNGKYASDLSRIIGKSNIDALMRAINAYIGRLVALKTDNDTHPLSATVLDMTLSENAERARSEDSIFRFMWAGNFVAQRYDAARKEIESYL